MENLGKIIERYHSDFLSFVCGASVGLYFTFIEIDSAGLAFLFKFSVPERILIFILISLLIGKISYRLGRTVSELLCWLLFQNEKIKSLKDIFLENIRHTRFGLKNVEHNPNRILDVELLNFIEKSKAVKDYHDDIQNEKVFWNSLLGGSLILFVFYFKTSNVFVFYVILLVSLVYSIYLRGDSSRFKMDCAQGYNRKKEKV